MRRFILAFAMFGGIMAALSGLGLGGALILLTTLGRAAEGLEAGVSELAINTLTLGAVGVPVGLGLGLAWAGWRGLSGAPGRSFSLLRWGWWLLAFGSVLAAGYALFSTGMTSPLAPIHLAANCTASFLVLALAVGAARRSGAAISARSAVGSLAWGGLGGVSLAFAIEVLVALAALVVLSLWLTTARADLMEQLRAWALALQGGHAGDPGDLISLLRSPWTAFIVLGFVSLLVPLVEEGTKALAVPLVAGCGRRLSRVDAYLLGTAAGAGFALVEGVLNGTLGLTSPAAWASAMLMRGAAATMHCAASGLAGLGWHAIIVDRHWYGALLGLLAIILHGAWNSAALGIAAHALAGGGNPIALLFVGFLGSLWLLAALSLALLPRWLARIDALT